MQQLIEKGVRTLDVNQQNKKAYSFYLKHGFKEVSHSLTDVQGQPYPLLHLELDDRSLKKE